MFGVVFHSQLVQGRDRIDKARSPEAFGIHRPRFQVREHGQSDIEIPKAIKRICSVD
jgi:hypothetical protein